jgi:hypothetical protein
VENENQSIKALSLSTPPRKPFISAFSGYWTSTMPLTWCFSNQKNQDICLICITAGDIGFSISCLFSFPVSHLVFVLSPLIGTLLTSFICFPDFVFTFFHHFPHFLN